MQMCLIRSWHIVSKSSFSGFIGKYICANAKFCQFTRFCSIYKKMWNIFWGRNFTFFARRNFVVSQKSRKPLKILRHFSGGGHSGGVPGRPAAADPGADIPGGGGTRRWSVAAELGRVYGTVSAVGGFPSPEAGRVGLPLPSALQGVAHQTRWVFSSLQFLATVLNREQRQVFQHGCLPRCTADCVSSL